jgi:hypothetical protein
VQRWKVKIDEDSIIAKPTNRGMKSLKSIFDIMHTASQIAGVLP